MYCDILQLKTFNMFSRATQIRNAQLSTDTADMKFSFPT